MAVSIQAVEIDQLDSLDLGSFRCSPGCGDALAVEATIHGWTTEELVRRGALLVAATNGALSVGVAVAVLTPLPRTWQVPVLAIHSSWQGQGLGRQIKDVCIAEIRAAEGLRVVSSVHEDTEAMHKINRSIAGVKWEHEVDGPGITYSIDLS